MVPEGKYDKGSSLAMYSVISAAFKLFYGITLFLPKEVLVYDLRCPGSLQIYLRSKNCSTQYYHCLAVDNIINVFKEECKQREWVTDGHYPVIRGRYIDYETCPATTYQPVIYRSNEQHTCLYQKSICSGEGLVEFSSGNTTTDRTCRCDYTKGYIFIVRPKHGCFCIPSEEDCSCFIKVCSKEEHKINADYKCAPLTAEIDDEECPPIKRKDSSPRVSTTISHIIVTRESEIKAVLDDRSLIGMLGAASIVVAIVVAIVFWICVKTKKIADTNGDNSQTGHSTEKVVSQSLAETKKIVDTYAENSQTGHVAFKEVSFHSSELKHRKCQASQRKSELKADDYGLRPGTERVDVELSDIIILHLDEKEGASEFKSHLEKLLKDISPTVKFYEEIFEQTDSNAVVNLEDVLNTCRILFVYISNNFVPSKVRRFGFDEKTFLSALTEDAKENYLNLKTVIDCEKWRVYSDNIRTDFNYLELKTYDDQIKDVLFKLINDIQK